MKSPALRSPYYPALDGFRAIAVLMVFTVHYLGSSTPLLGNWGWMGVDFFFVLSGFLITGILYDSRDKAHRFRDFYARRVLRIFPLYYGVWLALLLLWAVFGWNWNAPWLLWPLHLGNLARFAFFDPASPSHLDVLTASKHTGILHAVYIGHFWSLCIEEQFYVMWPLVVLLVRSRKRLMLLSVAVVVLEPLLRLGLLFTLPRAILDAEFLARFTGTRLDALVLGGLLALWLRGEGSESLHRYGRWISVGSTALFAAMIVEYGHRNHTFAAMLNDPMLSTFGLTVVDLLGLGIILELIRPSSFFARALTWSPLRQLGQISYGFYVFHDIPHDLYRKAAEHLPLTRHPYAVTAAIAFACTLALSLASFRFYETPFLRLKRVFVSQVHLAPRPERSRAGRDQPACVKAGLASSSSTSSSSGFHSASTRTATSASRRNCAA